MTAADYYDEQAAYNLVFQYTVAASIDGVGPDEVSDIIVTGASGAAVQRSDSWLTQLASEADSCRLSYKITVYDPLLTYDELRAQLIDAASSGAMDENLHLYAAEFGADSLVNCTLSAPVVRSGVDKESSGQGGQSGLSTGGIAGVVIGSFAGGCLVVATIWWFAKRRNQHHHESKVSTCSNSTNSKAIRDFLFSAGVRCIRGRRDRVARKRKSFSCERQDLSEARG
jgi:hypothetical protein